MFTPKRVFLTAGLLVLFCLFSAPAMAGMIDLVNHSGGTISFTTFTAGGTDLYSGSYLLNNSGMGKSSSAVQTGAVINIQGAYSQDGRDPVSFAWQYTIENHNGSYYLNSHIKVEVINPYAGYDSAWRLDFQKP